jgi:hypothetical protein
VFGLVGEIKHGFEKKFVLGNKSWDIFCPKEKQVHVI